jgi:hypothetical protein
VSFCNITLYKRHPWLISVSGSSSALLSTRLFAPARSSSPYFIAALSFVIYLQRRWEWGKNMFPHIIKPFYYEYPIHYWSLHVLHLDIQVILWEFQSKYCMALSKMIFKCQISNINHDSNEPTSINLLRSKIHLNDV